ncbi:glycosyltransferase family 2 protein [Leuconostoc citreum]|uniref:glycosyltransferase family 2 protein n=1 Tax=Leuconostoc citreum TaxID=33964 RepID=UPI002073ED53|nr:glycosyltransferase family 2 protein [Leuconostoc citreum]
MVLKINITVLTTTYNRADFLQKLYDSLGNQTDQDFQWLIIDDGSTDNTFEVIEKFLTKQNDFRINYFKKVNGGKHTALNYAHNYITGDVIAIVDSDDILVPEAVSTIRQYWDSVYENEKYATVVFERINQSGVKLGQFPDKIFSGSDLDYRIKKSIVGDFAETIRASIFKSFPFPIYKNKEKFFPEGWLWTHVALQYNTLNISQTIVVGGYQEDGLTKRGRLMRLQSPVGLMKYYRLLENVRGISFSAKIKNALAFNVYKLSNQKAIHTLTSDEINIEFGNDTLTEKILKLPAIIIYYYWKKR